MFNSNNNNIFEKYKNSFKISTFNNDKITQEDIRAQMTKKKEKQIAEHRKKMLKDIYTKMFTNNINIQSRLNINNNTSNNNMEIENEISSNNISNDEENKKRLIQEFLNDEKNLYNELGEEFIYQIVNDK